MFSVFMTLTISSLITCRMRQIKKMQANHMYLIRGASTANSPFFESEGDCRLFLELADRFLGNYVTISSFQNNRDGWMMIIVTRSSREIKRAYYLRRALSSKCKKACEYKEVWRMLSDQIRIFLSTYVKTTNYRSGRMGGKVRCRYERFVFDNEEEAVALKEMMEREYCLQAQQQRRYRPARKLHRMRKRLIRTSVYVSSRLLGCGQKLAELGVACVDVGLFQKDIVRQLIFRTLHHHFPT